MFHTLYVQQMITVLTTKGWLINCCIICSLVTNYSHCNALDQGTQVVHV